jgi:hypothetical protein
LDITGQSKAATCSAEKALLLTGLFAALKALTLPLPLSQRHAIQNVPAQAVTALQLRMIKIV